MSHSYNCPHCGDCLGPNSREVPRDAYCGTCGRKSRNHEGWREPSGQGIRQHVTPSGQQWQLRTAPAKIEEIPLECDDCGKIHSNTLLERTGGKCPEQKPNTEQKP